MVSEIVKIEEYWRFSTNCSLKEVDFGWKASQDLLSEDNKGCDVIISCAIAFPDWPFSTGTPKPAINGKVAPAVGLLEAVGRLDHPLLIVSPSTSKSIYGRRGTFD